MTHQDETDHDDTCRSTDRLFAEADRLFAEADRLFARARPGRHAAPPLPEAWTAELEERYRLVARDYGVAVYRRSDGVRMGGWTSIEEAAADLARDPKPDRGMPHLSVRDRQGRSLTAERGS